MSNAALRRRYAELDYRMIETALTPDHPTTMANLRRWRAEFRDVKAECLKRGLLRDAS